jgi:hypothetical protein
MYKSGPQEQCVAASVARSHCGNSVPANGIRHVKHAYLSGVWRLFKTLPTGRAVGSRDPIYLSSLPFPVQCIALLAFRAQAGIHRTACMTRDFICAAKYS